MHFLACIIYTKIFKTHKTPIRLREVAINVTKADATFVKIILSNREIFVVLEQVYLTLLDPI